MFCPKCGNEVPEGSGFCGKCGAPINQGSVHAANTTASRTVSNSAPAGVAAAMKKPILPIAIAIIIIAIIVVVIVTGGFGLFSSGSGVDPKDSLEEYTWEELSAMSSEIATASDEDAAIEIAKKYNLVNDDGLLDGTQTKSVTLTDGTVNSVQIAGFIHDDKSDGSGKAGITFIFADAISEMYMNSDEYNDGGWEFSDMRSWLASEGKALLPEELQDVIVAVDKSTNNVGETEDVLSVTTTSDELWLFSYVELAGELNKFDLYEISDYPAAIYNAEGFQYKLFSDCNVDHFDYNDILIKTYQGESYYWWERSPGPYSSDSFRCVDSDGVPYNGIGTDYSNAVVPGFCI